jgi:hypothetical protein
MQKKPNIRSHLLWEYDVEKFNWHRSYKIVIERVIERGWLNDWREIYRFYGSGKILETVECSKQLDERDKRFTRMFLKSHLLHAA